MSDGTIVSAAVEGIVDEVVVRKLILHAGGMAGDVYGKQGKAFLRRRMPGYNNAARHAPWIILLDLDDDAECAPPLRKTWLPDPAPHLCFRVAVRAIEAWLLADREKLAEFIGVAKSKLRYDPEALDNPKATMVDLARKSRRRDIQADMVPRLGSGRSVGPAYASRLIEFTERHWRPHVAARHADSLMRAIRCLWRLIERQR